jgi:hypothetical protein
MEFCILHQQEFDVNWLFTAQLVAILLALGVSFLMLVYPGADKAPTWAVYTSMLVAGIGGGAAMNLILFGLPK